MADLRLDAYPSPSTYPSAALYPSVPLDILTDPAGYITSSNGTAVPYALLLLAEETRDRRITVLPALNAPGFFTIGPANPAPPTWQLQFLLRTLTQAEALDNMAASSANFTISEWPGRSWTLTGQTNFSAYPIPGGAAWWTLSMEVISQ